MYNEELLELISDDRNIAYTLYHLLREKWPQLNEHTKLVVKHNIEREFTIESTSLPQKLDYTSAWYPKRPTWREFRLWLVWPRNLDNPEVRWQYQKEVCSKPVKILYWWVCRLLGRKLKRTALMHRGMTYDVQPYTQPFVRRDVVTLHRWGGFVGPLQYSFTCGYYPMTDTLYVRE